MMNDAENTSEAIFPMVNVLPQSIAVKNSAIFALQIQDNAARTCTTDADKGPHLKNEQQQETDATDSNLHNHHMLFALCDGAKFRGGNGLAAQG
jgi:hypothetical protein